ncbi:MAG: hypothetical protein WBJ99_00285, partial [Bacteroidales bacterium]
IYIANRTKSNFYNAIKKQNSSIKNDILPIEQKQKFLNSMNSYLGIMQHYKTYNMRRNMLLKHLDKIWWQYFYLSKNAKKFKTYHSTLSELQIIR